MSLHNHFKACLDLPGVLGAFCIREDGSLIESFLPAPYTDAVFEELGPRIANLLAAANMSYTETNEMLLRFSTNALYLKRGDDCVVGFLILRTLLCQRSQPFEWAEYKIPGIRRTLGSPNSEAVESIA